MILQNKKIWVPVAVILLLGGGIFLWYLQETEVRVPVGEEEEISFHFRLAGNEVVGWSRGEKVWQIKVDTILDPEEDDEVEKLILQDITEGIFYREGEDVFFTFTLDEAHYHTRSEDLTMFDVRMETPEGDWMESDEMYYEKASETLHSPGPVWGRMAGTDIDAQEMTVLLDKEEVILTGGVEMVHELEGE